MRIDDVLYFSPRLPFARLNLDDPEALIDALQDRVEGFYLQPASRSLAAGDVFVAGLVCCAAIDFLACVCEEIKPSDWMRKHVPAFNREDKIADQFWIRFRHGLMHEGYIKSQGQFSLETTELLTIAGSVLVVNPHLLLEAIKSAFSDYCKAFSAPQTARLAKQLHRYFDAEIEVAKQSQP